jgi:hypothetical protein
MSKMLEPLFQDILEQMRTPEVQTTLEIHILKPLMVRILHILYPYIFGIMLLWLMMFVCLALILLILVRGSLADLPILLIGGKQ